MTHSRLDKVVGYYVRHACHSGVTDQDELDEIAQAIKMMILEEALPQIAESKLNEALQKVEEEAKQHKKKLLQDIKITLIIETIFIAFLVGIMVNQVTNLIPKEHCIAAIIISLLLCGFMVSLAAAAPKE